MASTGPVLVVVSALLLPTAFAAPPPWGGSVTLSSNHLLRGVSRSSNDPSLSGELHVRLPQGWFAGVWAASSRVRAVDDTSVDLAATLGLGGALGEHWSWRGSYAHYQSPWQTRPSWYRYNEFTFDLQLRDALLLSASWSPDTTAYSPYGTPVLRRDAFTGEASIQQPLGAGWRVHAGAGYHDLSAHLDEGYWYGSLGFGWAWSHWRADLSYVHPGAAARRVSLPGTARRRALLAVGYEFHVP
jgi:uncharacterized protein (TIGR02001 family)